MHKSATVIKINVFQEIVETFPIVSYITAERWGMLQRDNKIQGKVNNREANKGRKNIINWFLRKKLNIPFVLFQIIMLFSLKSTIIII